MSFLKALLRAAQAAFGVQSKANMEADFKQQSPLPFIIAGVVFTALFVLVMIVLSQLLISAS